MIETSWKIARKYSATFCTLQAVLLHSNGSLLDKPILRLPAQYHMIFCEDNSAYMYCKWFWAINKLKLKLKIVIFGNFQKMIENVCMSFTHFIKQQINNKCLYFKPHPKIAWLILSGGTKLHNKNKTTIPLSLNYLLKTIIISKCFLSSIVLHRFPSCNAPSFVFYF